MYKTKFVANVPKSLILTKFYPWAWPFIKLNFWAVRNMKITYETKFITNALRLSYSDFGISKTNSKVQNC